MHEEGRPLGIKIMIFCVFFAGVSDLLTALAGSNEFLAGHTTALAIANIIGTNFSIGTFRLLVALSGLFNLWLGYLIFSFKKTAWYLFISFGLFNITLLIIMLISFRLRDIPLGNIEQLRAGGIVALNIFWLCYFIIVKDYFTE